MEKMFREKHQYEEKGNAGRFAPRSHNTSFIFVSAKKSISVK